MNDELRALAERIPPTNQGALLYLELLKGCLTRELFVDQEFVDAFFVPWAARQALEGTDIRPMIPTNAAGSRREGRDHPPYAETMVGRARLDNVQALVMRAIAESVPGDLVETGVWRGGTVILMRAILAAFADPDRIVWACDSFEGLPEPDLERYPQDAELELSPESPAVLMKKYLAVSVEQVRDNFERYGLLDDRVHFVKGWFRDSLPDAPIERIAVLRLDGDLYESTLDALTHLEHKVAPGGFVIVDDYNGIEACRQAVDEYRAAHGITAPIHDIDWTGVWWQKSP